MKERRLIINAICGLANRMRAISSGLTLASDLNLKPEIIWPVDRDLFAPFGELFEINDSLPPVRNISEAARLLLYDDPRRKNLYLSYLLRNSRYGLILTDNRDSEILYSEPSHIRNIIRHSTGDILIQSGVEYYTFTPDFYRSIFKVRPNLIEEARRRLPAGEIIGLHIRRTDNAESIRHSPLSLFISAIKNELAGNPEVLFYVASDDNDVKYELSARFGHRIIYTEKIAERDSTEGIRDALVDMVTLSMCSKIYGSYWSSFSEAASLLGDIPVIPLHD